MKQNCLLIVVFGVLTAHGYANEPTAEQSKIIQECLDELERLDNFIGEADKEALVEKVGTNLDTLVDQGVVHPDMYFIRGKLLAAAGRPREAASLMQEFVETRDGRNDWRAFVLMGNLLVDSYPRLAKSHFSKAENLRPGDPDIQFGLARCAAKTGKRREAVRILRGLSSEDEDKKTTYASYLARTLFDDQQWEEAGRVAGEAIVLMTQKAQRFPDSPTPLLGLDSMYMVAISSLRAVMAIKEPMEKDYVLLANLVEQQTKNRSAISMFEVVGVYKEGMMRFGDNPPAGFIKAYAEFLRRLGRDEEAAALEQK